MRTHEAVQKRVDEIKKKYYFCWECGDVFDKFLEETQREKTY